MKHNGGARDAIRETKNLEDRLRRVLNWQGYRLVKSRARNPRDPTYGGYQIVDCEVGGVVAGWGNANRGYGLDLDQVEEWLSSGG